MWKRLFGSSAPFPTNKTEAITYAEEAARGLRLWLGIDIIIALAVFGAWYYGVFSATALTVAIVIVVAVAFGCPAIMILGFSIGCLRFLTPKEYYLIVKINA
ncbi:MAG: hypothetical protein WC643_03835 [Parcubacteria group bacterium]|jgi:hypothetical protein